MICQTGIRIAVQLHDLILCVFMFQLVQGNVLPTCVESSMYFWTHTSWESELSETSKRNTREAREITKVATTLCVEGGVFPSKITVLCSYRGQASYTPDVVESVSC